MIVRRHTTFPFSYTPCVIPTTKGIGLEFGILRLAGGESFNDQSGTERLFHLLFGAVSFEWRAGRGVPNESPFFSSCLLRCIRRQGRK